MTRRRTAAVVLAAGVALAAWSFLDGPPPSPVARLVAGNVERVEVRELFEGDDRVGRRSAATADPAVTADLLAVLTAAEAAKPHRCGARAELTVIERSGHETRLSLLPGHDERFYEARDGAGWWVRVDRAAFLGAMRRAGVDWLPTSGGP